MSVNEIKEAMKNGSVYFGLKQTLKNKKKIKSTFVAKDTREEILKELENNKIEYKPLKSKKEMSKLLDLNFTSEVFSIS
jgi:ribosomal protein L7Ae-like RNA K-turn-binding protein